MTLNIYWVFVLTLSVVNPSIQPHKGYDWIDGLFNTVHATEGCEIVHSVDYISIKMLVNEQEGCHTCCFLLSWETCCHVLIFFLFLAKEKHTWKYNILGKNRVIQFY